MALHTAPRLPFVGGLFPLLACLVASSVFTATATAYPDAPPLGRTGAPTENTCASCHGTLNDGLGGVLEISGVPASYIPGQTYTLTISLTRTGKSRWGFEMTSLRDADDSYAGVLADISVYTGKGTRQSKDYIYQTNADGADGTYWNTNNGPVTWPVEWTAPAAGAGSVTFYAVGVAGNGDNNADSGDPVYTTSVTAAEEVTTPTTTTTWGWIKDHYR